MQSIWQDLRYGIRMLRKNSGFTLVAVLTLALGIGANSAIFSLVQAVLLNSLPFPDSDRLVVMSELTSHGDRMSVSLLNFQDWQAHTTSYDSFGGFRFVSFNLTGAGTPLRLSGQAVTWNFFHILGVKPQLGRSFTESEDQYGITPSAVISDSLWKETFGSDPNILGRALNLGGTDFTVVGVLPAGFEFISKCDVWAPLGGWIKPNSSWFDRGDHLGINAVGRLKPHTTLDQANLEIRQIAAQLEQEYPATNSGNGAVVRSLQSVVVSEVRPILLVLMAAVGFILLIACVNVANLLLARAAVRQQEIGVRLALGASRRRLMRQLLTESVLLALLGGGTGVVAGRTLLDGLLALAPSDFPRVADVQMNARVLFFTACLTVLTSLLFGLIPAWQTAKTDVFTILKQTGRSPELARKRLFDVLFVAEVSLALVLLTGAALMTRSVYKLTQVNPGFRVDHLLTMELDLVGPAYNKNVASKEAFCRSALSRLESLTGIESATLTSSLPIVGSEWGSVFIIGDQPVPERSQIPNAAFNPVSANYFQTMEIRLDRGRMFSEADGANTARVAIINESMARRYWPDENPIGKRLKQGWPEWATPWCEVVGVVEDVKLEGVVQETPLHIYLPLAQSPLQHLYLALRTRTNPALMAAAVQETLHQLDPQLPVYEVRTMEQIFNRSILVQRAAMILLGGLAILAIVLAAVGIYGVISWGAAQRTQEMGLRMALGAHPGSVRWLILRRSILLVLSGIVFGMIGAFILTSFLHNLMSGLPTGEGTLLFGVSVADPVTLISVPCLLSIVALTASYLPARRASKVDPMIALRYE